MAARERRGGDEAERTVREAAEALRGFSREVEGSTRAVEDNARTQREEQEARKATVSTINAGLGVASNAIGAIGASGDLDSGLASLTRAGINAVRGAEVFGVKVGEFAAEASGLNRADRILGTAAERTLDVTADLARYGIEVDPDFRQRTIDVAIEQEKRVEEERAKVSGAAYTTQNVGGIVADQGAKLLEVVEKIAQELSRLSGGSN